MFKQLQEKSRAFIDSIQEKSQAFSDSVDSLNKDLKEIRDLFIQIKDIIASVFSFMGKETAILLFLTFLFLFIINLIPFFFFGKKTRYFIGIAFGIFCGVFFNYTAFAVLKYALIMLLPIALEYIIVTTVKAVWSALKKISKKICLFVWEVIKKSGSMIKIVICKAISHNSNCWNKESTNVLQEMQNEPVLVEKQEQTSNTVSPGYEEKKDRSEEQVTVERNGEIQKKPDTLE